jgi:pimeloyl-ACP methyl ester carboxylesterase
MCIILNPTTNPLGQIIMIATQNILQKETIIYTNGLELWTESFGKNEDSPIILIMGAGGQGILWPTEFCRALAGQGYFVVRYDNRDTGLSSSIDFDANPYTLLDMATDVVHILDHYKLQHAHIVGASMGGAVAMILGAHYPKRVRSLTLLATTIDFRPAFDAMQGITSNHSLPAPSPSVIEAAKKFQAMSSLALEEKIQFFIDTARLNSGSILVDESLCREIAILNFERMKNPESPNNHYRAIMASYDLHATAPDKITAPTHVVHGDEDPIFPLEHGKATHEAIKKSTFCIISGLGHNFSCRELLSPMVTNIVSTAKAADKHI